MLGHRLPGDLCGPVIYPAIIAGLSSARRPMLGHHLSGDLCSPTIYPAIYHPPGDLCGSILNPAIYADLLYIHRTLLGHHLSGNLRRPVIYPAIYADHSSIWRSMLGYHLSGVSFGQVQSMRIKCVPSNLCGATPHSRPPMPICAPAQCPSTNHGCAPAGMHSPYFATQCSRPHANLQVRT